MPKLPRVFRGRYNPRTRTHRLHPSSAARQHVVLKGIRLEKVTGCVVPLHVELATRTLRGILKQAGITTEEFIAKL